MTSRDWLSIGRVLSLTFIAWLVPPRLWRKAAVATSSVGRSDRSAVAYRQNLAQKYSLSDIAAITIRRRAYLRELRFEILGLNGPWRSWRPPIRLIGAAHLQQAIEAGRGAILWVTETSFSTLIAKMALHAAGYRACQLSRPQHGFSTTPFGMRFLNPIWTRIEDRFIAERILIKGETGAEALAVLRERLGANHIVIITVVPQAHKLVEVPFLHSRLPLPTGPIRLAKTTGAALLPVFTLARDDGGFDVTIHHPLYPVAAEVDDASIATGYAKLLQTFALHHPAQWNGWQWLKHDTEKSGDG